jgi:hypothetical protein
MEATNLKFELVITSADITMPEAKYVEEKFKLITNETLDISSTKVSVTDVEDTINIVIQLEVIQKDSSDQDGNLSIRRLIGLAAKELMTTYLDSAVFNKSLIEV